MTNRQPATRSSAMTAQEDQAPSWLTGYAGPIIVHNHYEVTGNGNVVNNGRSQTIGAGSGALLDTIKAQAATISQMLNTIEAQAAQLARLKEELRRATATE